MSFLNKVVLITGAGSGIGRATAIAFAKNSATLVLIDVKEDYLNKVVELCSENTNVTVIKHIMDITDDNQVKLAIEHAVEKFGGIDVLVNCAGIHAPDVGGVKDDRILETFDKIFTLNLRAVVAIIHFAAPHLVKSKGVIVNMSSVVGQVPCAVCIPYPLSKAAISHLTRCVALELAKDGVRVNSISPGPVKTGIFVHSGLPVEQNEEVWDTLRKQTALKSVSEPEEVADLILYLASDKAKSVTGANFDIDNGMRLLGNVNLDNE